MRFSLLDRITDLQEGKCITAAKILRADEDYLADHFPRFPVMPGVLMLEAMFQAGAWLVRQTEGFANSCVVLKEARNVQYKGFVEPGQELVVTAEITKQNELLTTLKAQGNVDGVIAVRAKLVLESFSISDRYPVRVAADEYGNQKHRAEFSRLLGEGA